MYVNDNNFSEWMEKLSKKLNEIGIDLKLLVMSFAIFQE